MVLLPAKDMISSKEMVSGQTNAQSFPTNPLDIVGVYVE